MKTNTAHTSTCSNCQFFRPDGNLHGSCRQLHVTVDGNWPGCPLGTPAFASIDELLAQLEIALQEAMRTEELLNHR